MTGDDIVALAITGGLGLLFIVLSIFLLSGRGSTLIAGFNTMSKDEKEKYDKAALCKFTGKILLPVGILFPGLAISGIYEIFWFPIVFAVVVFGACVFAIVYANTGNRFKK